MIRWLFPHPVLVVFLTLVWLVLTANYQLGNTLLAVAVAIAVARFTAPWWPGRPRLKRPLLLVPYTFLVLWDVIVSSFQVAKVILFLPSDQIRTAWVRVPVELKSPEAVALLAGTITMTPGTLTAQWSDDGTELLIHSLHAPDPDEVREGIKSRYETRLKRIFG